jgi:hypothetical protein
MARVYIHAIAFSIEGLRRDADEIAGWGGGNEAAMVRWAADEMERLSGLLRHHGIDPQSEYICKCGLRRSAPQGEPEF